MGIIPAFFDGIGMGIGFTCAITCIGLIREFIGGSTYASEDPMTGKKTFVGSNYLIRNVANFLRDKHDVLKEKHEEFWEKHDGLKKDLIEKHEELVDSFEEAVEETVESIEKGEGENRVK